MQALLLAFVKCLNSDCLAAYILYNIFYIYIIINHMLHDNCIYTYCSCHLVQRPSTESNFLFHVKQFLGSCIISSSICFPCYQSQCYKHKVEFTNLWSSSLAPEPLAQYYPALVCCHDDIRKSGKTARENLLRRYSSYQQPCS